jgi:hypothetical protein
MAALQGMSERRNASRRRVSEAEAQTTAVGCSPSTAPGGGA